MLVAREVITSPPNECYTNYHSDLDPDTIAGIVLFVCVLVIAPM
jgi:hypothetical protein